MAIRGKGSRTFTYFAVVALFLVFTLSRIRHERHSPALQDGVVGVTGNAWPSDPSPQAQDPSLLSLSPVGSQSRDDPEDERRRPSFYEIAIEKGTDKVAMHTYQDTYERYLPARRRGRKVKLLELGLGCDAGYGPGASYYTWLEYFPSVELYFIEADAECAGRWRAEMADATVVEGDPGDRAFLEGFLRERGMDFDVVVGGGGHTVEQQMASLETLWKAVRPGGVYFCEYLETSYLERYGGGNVKPTLRDTMVHFLHDMIEDLMYPDPNVEAYHLEGPDTTWPRKVQFDEVESIRHIDCSRQICAISKRAD